jgi:hypothetical protein
MLSARREVTRFACKPRSRLNYPLLKNWTARSCFLAAARDENVPRFLRLPVFAFFFREYRRYSPDFSLRIMPQKMLPAGAPVVSEIRNNTYRTGAF